MNAALVHRGPDGGGTAAHGSAAIGMRRLAIVDVAGGQQPMLSPDRRFALVYNGEVYDFTAARSRLAARGWQFTTRSDTEVILAGYALDGLHGIDALNGIFAFAVSDASDGSVLLVRDQFGVKPLYYHLAADGTLTFSSELGSLLAHAAVPRRLDRAALTSLLVDRFVADPYTLFEGIRQVPPGHHLRWQQGRVTLTRYYHFAPRPQPMHEAEAQRELAARLDETIRSQLVADVPVGAFLSGGVDSSTVVAFARPHVAEAFHTFSVGFAHAEYDESAVAAAVARHLGTRHHALRVEDAGFRPALLETIVDHLGQPLGDTSCIPTWLVSEHARRHVKVVLSGDGGDEFFAGYNHAAWFARIDALAARVPAPLAAAARRTLDALAPLAPARLAPGLRRARRVLSVLHHERRQRMREMMHLWPADEAAALLAAPLPGHGECCAELAGPDVPAEAFALDYLAKTFMVGAILRKVDRMSMGNSLEVRVPLLDRRIVEFALTVPMGLKRREGVGKHLLRSVGRERLPEVVYRHPKQGFTPPLAEWFNQAFWDCYEDLAASAGMRSLFRPGALAHIAREGRAARAQEATVGHDTAAARAWIIAQLGCWLQRFRVGI